MFNEIEFSLIKKRVWDDERIVDADKINPDNLKYKISKDGSFDFNSCVECDETELNDYDIINDNIYLQIQLCNMYFYLKNFNIPLTTNLICNALNMNEEDICKVCLLFESVVFDENYPIFKDNKIYKNTQALQVTGLSCKGKQIAQQLIKNNEVFNLLFNNPLSDDLNRTAFFKFENSDYGHDESGYEHFVGKLLENEYLKKCGTLNVSALSFDSLEKHQLCVELSKNVNELYLLTYDVEYDGKVAFVKYLQWY